MTESPTATTAEKIALKLIYVVGMVCHPKAYEDIRRLNNTDGAAAFLPHIPVAVDPGILPEQIEIYCERPAWEARLDEIKNRDNTGREDDD